MKEVIEGRMYNAVDAHLEQMRAAGLPDRRNGSFPAFAYGGWGSGTPDPPEPYLQRSRHCETVRPSEFPGPTVDPADFPARSVHEEGGTGTAADSGGAG